MGKMLRDFFDLLKEAAREWSKDKASRLAAALSYYTIFALAPIVVVFLNLLGLIYRDGGAGRVLLSQVTALVGESGGEVFEAIIESASQPDKSALATVIGLVVAVFGASGVFVQLKDALNTAWGITEERFKGLKGLVRVRAISLSALLAIAFMLLVSLILSAGLTALTAKLQSDQAIVAFLIQALNFLLSIGTVTVLFAMMYKFLPDTEIAWKDVWIGALFTSVLFNLGKFAIGLYLGRSNIGSTYGAAGSALILLLWVYYSAQIILFGAEFTQVYSGRFGSKALTETPKQAWEHHPEKYVALPNAAIVDGVEAVRAPIVTKDGIRLNAPPGASGGVSKALVLGLMAAPFVMQLLRIFKKPRLD